MNAIERIKRRESRLQEPHSKQANRIRTQQNCACIKICKEIFRHLTEVHYVKHEISVESGKSNIRELGTCSLQLIPEPPQLGKEINSKGDTKDKK